MTWPHHISLTLQELANCKTIFWNIHTHIHILYVWTHQYCNYYTCSIQQTRQNNHSMCMLFNFHDNHMRQGTEQVIQGQRTSKCQLQISSQTLSAFKVWNVPYPHCYTNPTNPWPTVGRKSLRVQSQGQQKQVAYVSEVRSKRVKPSQDIAKGIHQTLILKGQLILDRNASWGMRSQS